MKCDVTSSSLRCGRIPISVLACSLYRNVQRCEGLSVLLLQLKDPLEIFVKLRKFVPGFGFLSRRDITVAIESDVETINYFAQTLQHGRGNIMECIP